MGTVINKCVIELKNSVAKGKKMKKIMFSLVALLFAANASAAAGYIVQGAQITKMSSTSENKDAYWVYYEGGQNDKCNGRV